MNEYIIQTVIDTLNTIEVHGKTNLSRILGCISALEQFVAQGEEEPQEKDKTTEEGVMDG